MLGRWQQGQRLSHAGYIGGPLSREDLFSTNDFLPVILACILFTVAPPFRFTQRAIARGLGDERTSTEETVVPAADATGTAPEKRSSPSQV